MDENLIDFWGQRSAYPSPTCKKQKLCSFEKDRLRDGGLLLLLIQPTRHWSCDSKPYWYTSIICTSCSCSHFLLDNPRSQIPDPWIADQTKFMRGGERQIFILLVRFYFLFFWFWTFLRSNETWPTPISSYLLAIPFYWTIQSWFLVSITLGNWYSLSAELPGSFIPCRGSNYVASLPSKHVQQIISYNSILSVNSERKD